MILLSQWFPAGRGVWCDLGWSLVFKQATGVAPSSQRRLGRGLDAEGACKEPRVEPTAARVLARPGTDIGDCQLVRDHQSRVRNSTWKEFRRVVVDKWNKKFTFNLLCNVNNPSSLLVSGTAFDCSVEM